MNIIPRSTIGTPQPPATRRKLDRVDVLLAHHVGVSTSITSRYQHASQELSDAKAAATWGNSSGRSWEYSYMIGLGGSIFEQAGEYMAQHCLNFNTASGGVLFLNADEVQVNDAQIAAWHWLRGEMVRLGILSADHEVAPHYRYRSTGCPGIRAQPPGGPWESPTGEGRMGNLIPELLGAPLPPTGDSDMILVKIDRGGGEWTGLSYTGAHLAHVTTPSAWSIPVSAGAYVHDMPDSKTVDDLIRSAQTTTPCPPEWVGTPRGVVWDSARR